VRYISSSKKNNNVKNDKEEVFTMDFNSKTNCTEKVNELWKKFQEAARNDNDMLVIEIGNRIEKECESCKCSLAIMHLRMAFSHEKIRSKHWSDCFEKGISSDDEITKEHEKLQKECALKALKEAKKVENKNDKQEYVYMAYLNLIRVDRNDEEYLEKIVEIELNRKEKLLHVEELIELYDKKCVEYLKNKNKEESDKYLKLSKDLSKRFEDWKRKQNKNIDSEYKKSVEKAKEQANKL